MCWVAWWTCPELKKPERLLSSARVSICYRRNVGIVLKEVGKKPRARETLLLFQPPAVLVYLEVNPVAISGAYIPVDRCPFLSLSLLGILILGDAVTHHPICCCLHSGKKEVAWTC